MIGIEINDRLLYTVEDVARVTGRSKGTIYRWLKEGLDGRTRSGGDGGQYYIPGNKLREFMTGVKVEG